MKKLTLVWLSVFLFVSISSEAAPLNRGHIPAEAKWLVHLDVEEFKGSEMWRLFRPKISEETWREVDEITNHFGSNPEKDIDGVTLYGTDSKEENSVVMIYGKFNKQSLLGVIGESETYAESDYKDRTLYHWVDEGYSKEEIESYLERVEQKLKREVEEGEMSEEEVSLRMERIAEDAWGHREEKHTGMFAAEDHIVFSQNEQAVKLMVDLLAGEGDSLASEDAQLAELIKANDDAILITAVTTTKRFTEFFEDEPEAVIMRHLKMLSASAGEDNGQMYLTVEISAWAEDSAVQIEKVLDGIVAMKTLECMDDKLEFLSFLHAIELERNENKLFLRVQYPSAKLNKVIEEIYQWGKKY